MSDIKAGDLVMVVRGHVCNVGKVWRVHSIVRSIYPQRCMTCGAVWESTHPLFVTINNSGQGYCLDRLKKIDPPSEVEFTKTERELTV